MQVERGGTLEKLKEAGTKRKGWELYFGEIEQKFCSCLFYPYLFKNTKKTAVNS